MAEGTEGQGSGQQGGDAGAMVPSSRLREETAARQVAEARATELQGRITTLEAGAAGWAAERDVYRAGITDPEGVEVALFLHGKLPAGSPAAGPWIQGLKPESAPKALAAYLPGAATQAQTTTTQARAGEGVATQQAAATQAAGTGTAQTGAAAATTTSTTTQATQGSNGTTAGAGSRSGGYDEAQIRAMREEAQRTGDYTKLRAAMPEILRSAATR